LEEVAGAAFEASLPSGTVSHLGGQLSAALAGAHAGTLAAVRQAVVKQVDKTGRKLAVRGLWRWVAAAAAVVLIHAHRGFAALKTLLRAGVRGYLCGDRWPGCGRWPA
jgi:hypothetical protein